VAQSVSAERLAPISQQKGAKDGALTVLPKARRVIARALAAHRRALRQPGRAARPRAVAIQALSPRWSTLIR